MNYLFFYLTDVPSDGTGSSTLDSRYRWFLWRPTLGSICPRGLPWWACARRWLWHYLHIYACRDYSILAIYDGELLVHRSMALPRWLRFPFMQRDDLQIALTWTHPDYRGQGVASFALRRLLEAHARPGRRFWYLTHKDNVASIQVARKGGFVLAGRGNRISQYGCRTLGCYRIEERVGSADTDEAATPPAPRL